MNSDTVGQWLDIGPDTQIKAGTGRTLPVLGGEEIAVFLTSRGEYFALVNKCPHKHGPLSEGLVHGDSVTCPLHNWRISLRTGEALGDDRGCTPTIPLKVESGRLFLLREAVLAPRHQAEAGTCALDTAA